MPEMSDWIEHDGKCAPDLPPGTFVQVWFRDGQTPGQDADPWEYWCASHGDSRDYWVHSDGDELRWQDDIIAYRVVQDEQ